MAQESKFKVAIIGAGPAGCMCAYFLQYGFDVTVFDKKSPLLTILPTGGGRCNIAHAEYDFKELVKNYPRGEKFLYSIFSRFSTTDTVDFFDKIGIQTYVQEDMRIFPISNSAKQVRETFLKALKKVKFIREEVTAINEGFSVTTDKQLYDADFVIIATGGHSSFNMIKELGHNIIAAKPALVGLKTIEDFSSISGVSVNNVLFTHKGISGPTVYRLSSIMARKEFPYDLSFDFIGELDLQNELNNNSHKSIKNLLADYIPKSFSEYVLKNLGINPDEKCHKINGKTRDKILNKLQKFTVTVVGTVADGEVVTAGGVDLKEINSKTMESKLIKGLYFCGEVLDIDGFCGGFNLQNCWSTGFVTADSIKKSII